MNPTKRRNRIWFLASRTLLLGGIVFLLLELPQLLTDTTAITSYVANLVFKHNFHEVVPGEFYRSGEMDRESLVEILREKEIKSLIDLRLDEDRDNGEPTERQIAEEEQVGYYRVPLMGSKEPTVEELDLLLDTFERAEKPILIHCTSGTHRTGVSSAIWLMEKHGVSPEDAADQLSTKYGFFRFERKVKEFFQRASTLDSVIWRYLDAHQKTGIAFHIWVDQTLPKRRPKTGPA